AASSRSAGCAGPPFVPRVCADGDNSAMSDASDASRSADDTFVAAAACASSGCLSNATVPVPRLVSTTTVFGSTPAALHKRKMRGSASAVPNASGMGELNQATALLRALLCGFPSALLSSTVRAMSEMTPGALFQWLSHEKSPHVIISLRMAA